MPDFLLHIYKKGGRPFQSLSDLPEEQALSIMRELYNQESVFWERFQDPEWYWRARTQLEQYLRAEFIAKGGRPKDEHPVYLVLGRPKWLDIVADPVTLATTDELRVPLSILDPHEVSFTYPDSMVSALMAVEKNPEYYEPDYHGKVFTLDEMMRIIAEKGLPGEGWQTKMPVRLAHYIEAQVWNRAVLLDYFGSGLEETLRQAD